VTAEAQTASTKLSNRAGRTFFMVQGAKRRSDEVM